MKKKKMFFSGSDKTRCSKGFVGSGYGADILPQLLLEFTWPIVFVERDVLYQIY